MNGGIFEDGLCRNPIEVPAFFIGFCQLLYKLQQYSAGDPLVGVMGSGKDYLPVTIADFDGIEVTPAGLENISFMPVLLEELSARGYSESDMTKIAGENFFRVMNVCARH